ncbi:hypothetical protein [Microbacterium rhizosphaerae]|uniref:DUF4878 domain-containing protein n=1 Tax=Microbacterium rhizosphaerae TaxID=1678237 RepID=A0ABZ0SHQ7_9MICO|nr:hypothetical protein [Microbacterium rhizosphaerae]WPR87973.1 hypothetical protein SM116_09215 [Microbacterium rhizosphaerae]
MSEEAKAMDAGYHPMRHVTAGESPWPGMLVRDAGGDSRLLVDAAAVDGFAGWDADPAGHVLAPLDVVRRRDGHDLLLPACSERLDAFLARRRDRRVPPTSGERVTIAISLLRGLHEAHERTAEPCGTWWLTTDGRPVIALATTETQAADSASACTARLLSGLSVGAEDRLGRVLARAAARSEHPRALAREADELEADLFACAAPEPLATAGVVPAGERPSLRVADELEVEESPTEDAGLWARITPLVDAGLADAASQVLSSLWRRFRRAGEAPPRGRAGRKKRGPVLLAGATVAVVVGIGMVWPGGPASPAQAGADRPAASVRAIEHPGTEPMSGPAPSPSTLAEEPADIARVVDALLTKRSTCGADETCLSAVQEDPRRRFARGAADLETGQRRITLLDSFGGAAVAKVEAAGSDQNAGEPVLSTDAGAPAAEAAGAQLVVVVRDGDRWLLRDVYGAQQQQP